LINDDWQNVRYWLLIQMFLNWNFFFEHLKWLFADKKALLVHLSGLVKSIRLLLMNQFIALLLT
jgi:hypothetical protein